MTTDIPKIFLESTLDAKFRIFMDMDGVLVNWNKGFNKTLFERDPEFANAIGYTPDGDPWDYEDLIEQYYLKQGLAPKKAKSKAKGKFWKVIHGDYEWWLGLEWMPDGKELFNYCLNLKNTGKISELNILSSPSSDSVCEPAKRAWLEKQGVSKYLDNIYIFKEKYKFAKGPKDILIDDTPKKTDEWKNLSNGTPVFHTSAADSIKQLEQIVGASNANSTNDPGSV